MTVWGVLNGTSVAGAGVVMAKLPRLTDSVSVAVAPKAVTVVVRFLGPPPVVRSSGAVLADPVVLQGLAIGGGAVVTVIETVAVMPLVVLACTVSVAGSIKTGSMPAVYVTATSPLVLVTPLDGFKLAPVSFVMTVKTTVCPAVGLPMASVTVA